MFKLFIFGLVLTLLSSCATFREPEFIGTEGIQLNKIDGKNISFTVAVKIMNPNWFGIKIKPSIVDVYMEDQFMGTVLLDEKLKLKAKKENDLAVPLLAVLEDGAMLTVLRYAKAEKVTVRIAGKVKGGIWIFSKKIPMDEKRTISGKDLRIGLPK
jgi:LEA14-like dessication related protein